MASSAILRVEQAYLEIRRRIVAGDYPQGSPLPEPELARSLDISRTPIREALCRLQEEGYVERRPGRGFNVAQITLKRIQDTFEVRRVLEAEAAAKAAARHDDRALQRLRQLAPLPPMIGEGAREAARLANSRFHLAVAETSGNALLVDLVRRCLDQIDHFMAQGLRAQAVPARTTAEHLEIVEAVSRRDREAASGSMARHLDECQAQFMRALVGGDRHEIAV